MHDHIERAKLYSRKLGPLTAERAALIARRDNWVRDELVGRLYGKFVTYQSGDGNRYMGYVESVDVATRSVTVSGRQVRYELIACPDVLAMSAVYDVSLLTKEN